HSEWCQRTAVLLRRQLAQRYISQRAKVLNTESFNNSHLILLAARQRHVVQGQQFFVFLQRGFRQLVGDAQDGGVVLPCPRITETGAQHFQPRFLDLAVSERLVGLELLQQRLFALLLQ